MKFFLAILPSNVPETKELAYALFLKLNLRCRYLPSITPTSSPRHICHLPSKLVAIAQRSASGSCAITKSALTCCANFNAKSIAPFSSGFGNGTVGKSASGCICSFTTETFLKPAIERVLRKVCPPTP